MSNIEREPDLEHLAERVRAALERDRTPEIRRRLRGQLVAAWEVLPGSVHDIGLVAALVPNTDDARQFDLAITLRDQYADERTIRVRSICPTSARAMLVALQEFASNAQCEILDVERTESQEFAKHSQYEILDERTDSTQGVAP